MQYFTLIGGFLGFVLTLVVSLLSQKDLSTSVFNATIGCVITGFLFRGFRFIAEYCAKQVVAERTRIRDEETAAAAAATAEAEAAANPPSETTPEKESTTPA
jgi:uncharacterized membrane protein YjfL (UPF0719 family)